MRRTFKACAVGLAAAMAAGILAACSDPLREGKTIVTFLGLGGRRGGGDRIAADRMVQ